MPINQQTDREWDAFDAELVGGFNQEAAERRTDPGMAGFGSAAPKRRPRILYATEDQTQCELLARGLAGYEVRNAASAADAIYLAMTGGFDLILVDDQLPGITGIEVCRQIRAYDHRLPILVIAGPDEEAKRRRALEAGAQGYWPQPLDAGRLDREIGRLLALKQQCLSASA